MSSESTRKPLMLMILDGWGYREESEDNAIRLGNTPCWDEMWRKDPHTLIETSGEAVGLPDGQMGNSEVGHMNIGAGRIVYQDFSRITKAIRDGSFHEKPALCNAIDTEGRRQHRAHHGPDVPGRRAQPRRTVYGNRQDGCRKGRAAIAVHGFLDGRDTPPRSAKPPYCACRNYWTRFPELLSTISGRYYAMDRDNRWDRVERAYGPSALAEAEQHADTALQGLDQAYARDENDEFVQPTVIASARV